MHFLSHEVWYPSCYLVCMKQAPPSLPTLPEEDEILQEKCGLVGIMSSSPEELKRKAIVALPTIVHRGADGTGYAFVGAETTKYHSLVPANQFAGHLAEEETKDSSLVILQSRYATSGDAEKKEELQPFLRATQFGKLALAFNGNIWNWNQGTAGDPAMKEQARTEGIHYPLEESTDTEIFFYLLAKSKEQSLEQALIKDVLPFVKGGYSLMIGQEGTVHTPDKLLVARDPRGFHPLWWAKSEDRDTVVASETCSLDALRISHSAFKEVEPGSMLVFTKDKPEPEEMRFANQTHTQCSLELMYFMRTDSLMSIDARNHNVKSHIIAIRKDVGKVVGKRLLRELQRMGYTSLDNVDVIPIPESGLPFGRGIHDSLAKEGAHLNEDAVILNPDAPKKRSFISKDERTRQMVAFAKRKFLRDLFHPGHDHIICDDTLIRGTTFKKLIQDLRGYITGRIHAVLSLNTFVDICPYGIAIKKTDELVTRVTGAIDPANLEAVEIDKIKAFIGLRPDELLLFGTPTEIRHVVHAEMNRCGHPIAAQKLCFACQGEPYPDGYPHTPVQLETSGR